MLDTLKERAELYQSYFRKMMEVKETLEERVSELVYRCAKVLSENEHRYGVPHGIKGFSWSLSEDYNNVCVEWYDTWNYGGYDAGEFHFPIELIWDESAFNDWKSKIEAQQSELQRIKKQEKLQEKIRAAERINEEIKELSE